MPKEMTPEELMDLDDEALSKMNEAPVIAGAEPVAQGAEEEQADQDPGSETAQAQANEEEADDQEETAEDDADADAADQPDDDAGSDDTEDEDPKPAAGGKTGAAAEPNNAKKPDGEGDPDPKAGAGETVDYKAAYERIMAPFKANGKMIKVDSPDEAIQLMQMGANYTRKIQALQPGLKVLRMLENHGLLDETKLSYLIDLSRKDPAAVKKLVKESGVDPMDIDTSKDPGYKPGNYQVSDEEVVLANMIRDIGSEQGGRELVQSIHKTWDQRSKDAILKDPDILRVLNEQRISGIYAKIRSEIERRMDIGRLSPHTPFLEAYRVVGEEMQRSGALAGSTANPQASKPISSVPGAAPVNTGSNGAGGNRRVVDQRVAQRKPSTATQASDRARAASPAPASGGKTAGKDAFNPLAMSDEDFEKAFAAGKRY